MIGGNVAATLQRQEGVVKNALGERVPDWVDVQQLTGFLDLSAGDSRYTYNAKIQESTHIFLCDYVALDQKTDDKRFLVGGDTYDVVWIDDPMGLHQHLEIFLRAVG